MDLPVYPEYSGGCPNAITKVSIIGSLVKLPLQSGQNHQIVHGVSLAPTEQF